MSTPTKPGFALRVVRTAFEHTTQQMLRMHAECQVKPADNNVIRPTAAAVDEDVTLECQPVVCRVPERANLRGANLYIVFTGFIAFRPEQRDGQLVTAGYGTNFAYFAIDRDKATHVLGGHYDFSPVQTAHPRAHLQLASQADLYRHAQAQFRSLAGIELVADHMQHVLHRVRSPSAQMDFLSFMLQVCADHLVDERSPSHIASIFDALAHSCTHIFGYHVELSDLCACHRATHWYPARPTTASGAIATTT